MENKKILIGSHVSLKAPNYFIDSVNDSISYGSNSLMIYTGAPQNTLRKDISLYNINQGLKIWQDHNLDTNNIIVHAPYIINLCSEKKSVRELAIDFLIKEISRTAEFKSKILVLHPGSAGDQSKKDAIEQIIFGLNEVIQKTNNFNVIICLETMAGKGTEIGSNFNELKQIINSIKQQDRIGVCLDTCHIHDAGYDLNNFDQVLNEFDSIIGLDYLKVLHINDSKNIKGSRKDRHENIGLGEIGFKNLINVIYHPKLQNLVKILETPYVPVKSLNKNLFKNLDEKDLKGKTIPVYKQEIEMILNKKFVKIKDN